MGRRFDFLVLVLIAAIGCNGEGEDVEPQIVPPGAARTLDFPGALTTVLLEGRATEGDVAVLEFAVRPRSFGAPPHVHHNEDEYFYVLEGEVPFLNGDRVVAAPTGTFAAMTRGHLHAFWNASDAPARVLVAIAPGAGCSLLRPGGRRAARERNGRSGEDRRDDCTHRQAVEC